MQATTNDLRREATETINGATRTAAETSRRTLEGMQAATQAGRSYLEESSQWSRKLLDAWASGVEASLKAGFDVQNATLTARFAVGITVLDTATNSTRSASQQWVAVARQAQEATLDAFRSNVRMMEKVVPGAARAGAGAK
jgi:hypothetical protein